MQKGILMDFWERKSNLKNKPTLKNRMILTLEYIAEKYNLSIGIVIEKLITKEINYDEEYSELKEKGTYGL